MITFVSREALKPFKGKICLMRIDLNIAPNAADGLFRLEAALPTAELLLRAGLRVALISHRGRPAAGAPRRASSLAPFAPLIARRLGIPVDFIAANRAGAYAKAVRSSDARIMLLENLRFFGGEEANDPSFAKALSACGDCFVNEAFPVCHRANASVAELPKLLPSFGGLRLKEELRRLDKVMQNPSHPFIAVVGGAKIGEKLGMLAGFLGRADEVLLGSSVFAEENPSRRPSFAFPEDAKAHRESVWDIGPFTMRRYAERLARAKTIVWNGPVGFSEKKGFERGTAAVWKALLANRRADIVVGGGETVASVSLIPGFKSKYAARKNLFLSTGGGAMLAYLSGRKLPGIEVLR